MNLHKLFCVATSLLVACPQHMNAGCAVQCRQQVAVVANEFIATNVAIPVGVPVANYAPYSYSYQPPPTVNVVVDTRSIASEVINQLRGSMPSPGPLKAAEPDVFAEPQPTGAVAANCSQCHGAGGKAVAKFSVANLSGLTCEQRLAAARAVLSTRMPKDRKLDADQAGKVLEELLGK